MKQLTDWDALRMSIGRCRSNRTVWEMEYEVARLHLMGFSDLCLTIEEIQGYLMWVGCLYDGDTVRHNIADIYLCDLCRDFLEKTIPEELRAALFSMLTALGTADDD